MWEAVSSCLANIWHVSKSPEYQQPLWFLQILFLSPRLSGSALSALSYELQQQKMLLPSGIVHSCSSGKDAVLVVLAAWIHQLLCTASGPVVGCREKKVKGERKKNSAVFWMLARIRVMVTREVTQCVNGGVQRRENHVSILMSRDFLFQHSRCCWSAMAQRLCPCIHLLQW